VFITLAVAFLVNAVFPPPLLYYLFHDCWVISLCLCIFAL